MAKHKQARNAERRGNYFPFSYETILTTLLILFDIFLIIGCNNGGSGGDGEFAEEEERNGTQDENKGSDITSTDDEGSEKVVGGSMTRNTVWEGRVLVVSTVVVERDVALTVNAGTTIRFKHYRGYRNPEDRLSLIIKGTIQCHGTIEQPIYFTSDADTPINGDWSMIRLLEPSDVCKFQYCVVEYAQQGLNVWRGKAELENCLFRFQNWEGVYIERESDVKLENCILTHCGYNGLAVEQQNKIFMTNCESSFNGTNGIHCDSSNLEVRSSLINNNGAHGLSVDANGTLKALGCNIYSNKAYGVGYGEGNNQLILSNLLV